MRRLDAKALHLIEERTAAIQQFKFPVHRPICNAEWTCALSVTPIKEALDKGTPIPAYAGCHDWHWDLKEGERQALASKLRT
jgi:hypothetical protein